MIRKAITMIAETRNKIASTVQPGLVLPRARRTTSIFRPRRRFVAGKPVQVGYPETGEFFGIALAVFPSPEQMAFEQTSPAVACVDIGMARPEDCPGCLGRDLQDVIIQDACSPDHSNRANSKALPKSFLFFPILDNYAEGVSGAVHKHSFARIRWSSRLSSIANHCLFFPFHSSGAM